MTVLFVVPYPPSAIRVRSWQLIRGLRRRGHHVTVATLWNGEEEWTAVESLVQEGYEVVSRPLGSGRSAWNCLRCLPSRYSVQAAFCWHPDLARSIGRHLTAQTTDVVHVEHLRGSRYALALDYRLTRQRPPIVWDSVDCISDLFSETLRHDRSGRGRWMARLDLQRTLLCEATLPFRVDRTVVCSDPDRDGLVRLTEPVAIARGRSSPALDVVPNGVDLDYFTPGVQAREPATLVLSGKMSYHANVTAARFLIQDVMPRVWSRRSDVRLSIVGRGPPSALRRLAARQADRITITGSVPDIRPYLRRATLSVVPVLYAAGTQLKALEAMACGTPVVSTAVGVSGLGVRGDRELAVANAPAALADEILDLLERPERREGLGRAGRRYVEREHSWAESARRLESVYGQAIEARVRASRESNVRVPVTGLPRALGMGQRTVKAAIDYLIALLLLLPLASLLLLLAPLIKLDSGGPVLHRRRVLGLGGRSFDALKLRTMRHEDGKGTRAEAFDRLGGVENGGKPKHDPRVTRVGRWLRRFSLDELPQLLNVLRGEMSLVGPRIMSPPELADYGGLGRVVLSVRPGMTGLWQVSGRGDLPRSERVRLDAEYVRRFSIGRDLRILFLDTPVAVLTGRGAY